MSTSSEALVGAAVLFLVPGFLRWPVQGIQWNAADVFLMGGAVFFLAMAAWARWTPLLPAAIGLAVFGLYFAVQYFSGGTPLCSRWRWIWWILYLTIAALLFVGLTTGIRATRQPLTPSEKNQP